jgi:hypothetical protein
MELAEKLEESFVAYLKSLTWPESLRDDPDDATTVRIFAGESDETKTGQCIVCVADDNPTEEPNNSGNCVFSFRVELRTPIADPSPIGDHKDVADALENAIMADGLGDLVNAAAYAKAVAEPDDFADLDQLLPVSRYQPHAHSRAGSRNLHVSGRALSCYCMGIKG